MKSIATPKPPTKAVPAVEFTAEEQAEIDRNVAFALAVRDIFREANSEPDNEQDRARRERAALINAEVDRGLDEWEAIERSLAKRK